MADDKNKSKEPEEPVEESKAEAGALKPPSQSVYAIGEKVTPRPIEDEMRESYIDYAMSVIVGRALPDIRDGLKPAHRRVLFAMNELGLVHNRPFKKAARVVGEVLGKYHPHGDVSVYDTIVRMVQDFSLRYPLIDGQGNFGSVDGDNAAAMRYTEVRLQRIANELLDDIDKNTVDFVPNFDESLTEPSILPSKLPNLLINGSSGIAVGMATNIPPHNLGEILDGLIAVTDNPEIDIKGLNKIIKGPDFPTGGLICGKEGIRSAYETGRGQLKMRARVAIETDRKERESIVVTEIPYQVNKANLIANIASLVYDKKIEGISDVRDESDRDGMRIVIELKRDQNAQVILNQLYKHTQLQDTFGVIMLALVDGQPKVLTIKEMLSEFLHFRFDVIMRRTKFELDKAEARAHILEGLKKAIANLNEIIKTIRASKDPEIAKAALIEKFDFTEIQAKAILEMQLQRLTSLEREKLEAEYLELIKKIEYFRAVLRSPKKVHEIIKTEFAELRKNYNDERRTQIVQDETDVEIEDLIQEEDVLVTLSHMGYIKRLPVNAYRRQHRGGKGVTGSGIRDEDFIEHMFLASTHDFLLFFTDQGRVHWQKAYEIPVASRVAKGKALRSMLTLAEGENITSCIQVKEFDDKHFLMMGTQNGQVKKTNLMAYSRPRQKGIDAITLKGNDRLIACKLTTGNNEIFLATKQGKAIRFPEKQVRETGRTASGVRGIRLGKGDAVVGMEVVQKDATILTITSKGFGKKTKFSEYRLQSRGGKGIRNIKATEKNGYVVRTLTVEDDDEIIMVTSGAMVVRCAVSDIRTSGRNAQGVRAIRLKDKDKVASAARVVASEEDDEEEAG